MPADRGEPRPDAPDLPGGPREALNKALQQLERQGFIALERRQITVLDLDAIRNRAS